MTHEQKQLIALAEKNAQMQKQLTELQTVATAIQSGQREKAAAYAEATKLRVQAAELEKQKLALQIADGKEQMNELAQKVDRDVMRNVVRNAGSSHEATLQLAANIYAKEQRNA